MAKNEQTSKKAGSAASKVLKSNAGKNAKTAAGSALSQRPDKKKK